MSFLTARAMFFSGGVECRSTWQPLRRAWLKSGRGTVPTPWLLDPLEPVPLEMLRLALQVLQSSQPDAARQPGANPAGVAWGHWLAHDEQHARRSRAWQPV